jgi:hypothetical protein
MCALIEVCFESLSDECLKTGLDVRSSSEGFLILQYDQ